MRIYSNPYELMSETARNLYEMGNEVKPRTYQNKVIEGKDDFITKELICEQYCLTHLEDPAPLFVFTKSKDWAEAEFQERIHPGQINPGEAWKLRPEIWEEFLVDGKYFDYTYSERMNEVVRYNGIVMTKLQAVIGLLKDDNDTRKAILNIYGEDGQVECSDAENLDGKMRIPCSMYYDFLIRENARGEKQLNICYQNENLKEVYKELFDEAVERYNIGKRKDRQITNYYEKIRQGKQEKLFHEVIFQIGNREDMAVGTAEGDLAVKILDEYVKDFQKRNATLRVFGCYLHQDESTPHLHIDFIPYVTDWKGKGMDTRVSLKQALKSLGFQGGNKHDTELNQWMNHEKKVLAEIAKQHGIEWEQKGTHEEHLDVYNFKKKERKKEVQELEQEKEYLTAENEELTAQIAEFRADIQILKDDKEQANREKQEAEQRAEDAEKEVKSLEERRDVLQPIMDNASKEIKEYGMIKTFLPEAGTFERAVPYRENKIKPLFIKMKNQIAALAGKVVELNKTIESWKNKYQKSTEKCDDIQTQLDDVRKENGKLSNDNQRLQEISDRYDRVVRILGMETVEDVVQQDIKEQRALEEKRRMEQMPKGSVLKQLEWATQKSQIENQQRKKNKTKYKGLEI